MKIMKLSRKGGTKQQQFLFNFIQVLKIFQLGIPHLFEMFTGRNK